MNNTRTVSGYKLDGTYGGQLAKGVMRNYRMRMYFKKPSHYIGLGCLACGSVPIWKNKCNLDDLIESLSGNGDNVWSSFVFLATIITMILCNVDFISSATIAQEEKRWREGCKQYTKVMLTEYVIKCSTLLMCGKASVSYETLVEMTESQRIACAKKDFPMLADLLYHQEMERSKGGLVASSQEILGIKYLWDNNEEYKFKDYLTSLSYHGSLL